MEGTISNIKRGCGMFAGVAGVGITEMYGINALCGLNLSLRAIIAIGSAPACILTGTIGLMICVKIAYDALSSRDQNIDHEHQVLPAARAPKTLHG